MTPPRRGRLDDGDLALLTWRARERRRARTSRRRRVALIGALVAAAAILALGAGAVGGAAAFGNCDLESLRPARIGENSFVYAADGSLLGSIPAERNRQRIPLGEMSPWLKQATIAIEDRRFYEHEGVDAEAIARALVEDIRAGRVVQGGSTITQQLVRNLYVSSRERTLQRKLKEACLAFKLDRERSKDWILENYLNSVYFGSQAYGAEAAAQTYFSKSARRLNLAQAALLAGLPQLPSKYDPFRYPSRALTRRNAVLRAMVETGAITPRERAFAAVEPLRLNPGRLYKEIREPYFFGYVRDELIREYGAARVRSGGLRVYTTINRRYQRIAQRTIRQVLYLKSDPSAALVAINPANGAIRAMVAVSRRKGNQFNLAAQARRQTGSTFKTFVLAAALDMGIDPDTSYLSAPLYYYPEGTDDCDDESAWCPKTYDHSYIGVTSIGRATLRSDNTVYARLTLDVGPERVARIARRLGVRQSPLTPVPALGLGAASISPLEMASAYATLAAGGIYSRPMAIRKVVLPSGEVDERWGKPHRERVLSDGIAYEITQILEENILYGTGYPNAVIGRPAAGKTGTTDDHADAWFAGYTPNLTTAVWVGHAGAQIPMLNVHGIRVAGGTFPAEIWGKFMRAALVRSTPRTWRLPRRWPAYGSFDLEYALSGGSDDYDDDYYEPSYTPPAETEEPESEERPEQRRPAPRATPTPTPTPEPPAETVAEPPPETTPEPAPNP